MNYAVDVWKNDARKFVSPCSASALGQSRLYVSRHFLGSSELLAYQSLGSTGSLSKAKTPKTHS